MIAIGALPAAGEKADMEDGEEVRTVRRIFELAAKEGYSANRIASELNEAGVPSPQGAAWTRWTVQRLIRNPIYAGERYGVKNAHPAIVSRRLWNAAQAALQRRSRG